MRVLKSILLGASILVPCATILVLGFVSFSFLADNHPAILGMGISIFGILLVCYCLGSSIGIFQEEETKKEDEVREEVINKLQNDNSYIKELQEKYSDIARNRQLDIEAYNKFSEKLNKDKWLSHLGFSSIDAKDKKYLTDSCKYWKKKYQL